jgi:hypothetical protein
MYKSSTYLQVAYLSASIWDLFLTELVTKMKPNINSVEVHPQLRKKRTSSGWCAGWVLVHCGLKIDPPVCKDTECHFYHFTCRFCSFLSPACPGRSGSCKSCLGNAGGIPLGSRLKGDYFSNSLLSAHLWSSPFLNPPSLTSWIDY